jgi:hypothetical protein
VFVAAVIVEDDVDDLASRDLAFDRIEEADELLMSVALHAAADDLGPRARRGWRTAWSCRGACSRGSLSLTAFDIIAAVQCVASPGGSSRVIATVRSRTLAGSGGMRDGRVWSRNRPATPARINRSCQRHTVTLLMPVRRIISLVPTPSAVSSTIRARQTCFCGLFRLATIASKRPRAAAPTATVIPSRMLAPPFGRATIHDQDSYVRFHPLEALPS